MLSLDMKADGAMLPAADYGPLQPAVDQARWDLAARQQIALAQITVLRLEAMGMDGERYRPVTCKNHDYRRK